MSWPGASAGADAAPLILPCGRVLALPAVYDVLSASDRRLVRNEYVARQGGLCQHCGAPLDGRPSGEIMSMPVDRRLFPASFFKWPVHLHHSHVTGLTIGAVHNRCNAVLWQYHGE